MNRHRRFTAVLILLLLVSTFVAALHSHENTADDHDCPICVVSNHQHAASQTAVSFDGVPFFLESINVASVPVIAKKIFTSFRSDRAPPA